MLGLVFIYFLGRAFYNLAEKFNKNPWGYAVLGVVVFYGGQFALGIVAALFMIDDIDSLGNMDSGTEMGLNIAGLFVGGLITWGFYQYLQHRWESAPVTTFQDSDILDDDFMDLKK